MIVIVIETIYLYFIKWTVHSWNFRTLIISIMLVSVIGKIRGVRYPRLSRITSNKTLDVQVKCIYLLSIKIKLGNEHERESTEKAGRKREAMRARTV